MRLNFWMAVVALAGLVGCGGASPAASPAPSGTPAPAGERRITVYCGRGESLVGELLSAFTQETGIQVDVRYEGTDALAQRIATEGATSPADVFFAQDGGYLGALAEKGLLTELPSDLLNRVPAAYRDAQGRWMGLSGRARVLVYSPSRVKAEDLPKSLADLSDPRWKGRLGWAPTNASFQAHISAVRRLWGEAQTESWLAAVKANAPVSYAKNGAIVQAVHGGEIDIGWVNHYYLHTLKASQPGLDAANYSFPESDDAGNLLMFSGAAILKGSRHPDLAREFLVFLVSEKAQRHFADKVYEYPTAAGVAPRPELAPIRASVAVEPAALADIAPTLALLRKLGLL